MLKNPGGVLAAKSLMLSSNFFGHFVMFWFQGNLKLSVFVLLLSGGFNVLFDNARRQFERFVQQTKSLLFETDCRWFSASRLKDL